jgi:hypothetical protein
MCIDGEFAFCLFSLHLYSGTHFSGAQMYITGLPTCLGAQMYTQVLPKRRYLFVNLFGGSDVHAVPSETSLIVCQPIRGLRCTRGPFQNVVTGLPTCWLPEEDGTTVQSRISEGRNSELHLQERKKYVYVCSIEQFLCLLILLNPT